MSRFPGSRSTDDLAEPFRSNVVAFISAMQTAGMGVRISATFRPKQRAYLMHFSVKVANGSVEPANVETCDGVDIQWDHGDATSSRQAARAMTVGYQIVFPAAYPTRHSERVAIDMTLTGFSGVEVVDAAGTVVKIRRESDLYPVGATFGVIKLVPDRPHWSDNGS